MAVLLVLASGTAVSLAVTDGESSAVGSNATAHETTDVGEETTEAGNQETTEVVDEETTEAEEGEDGDDTATESASVTMNDQESDGERIVIEEVTMEEGGFVAVHDETLLDGDALGSVVGTSVYLEAGTHENVEVTLGRPVDESQTLIAMPHRDTNDNGVYDFVISGGEADGPYAATDGGAVVDEASVTVGEDEVDDAETTEEDVVEETETEEDDVVETTEEDDVEETEVDDVETTEEDEVIETTTEEVDDVETTEVDDVETTEVDDVETTEVDDVETTAEEDEVEETTTEEVDDVETTEVDDVEEPAEGEQQVVFKVEQMNIDRWSFVVGDEETPDRTETVSDITVQDRRVEINLTELLQQQSQMHDDRVTTQDPEEAQEQVEDKLSGDVETVRFVIENVNVENVTFVITAPEDMELPETPDDMGEMTTEEDDELVETTTEEDEIIETTTEEVDDVETTEVDDVETTEVDDVETTEEVDDVETTEEDEVIETTTEEVDDVETTEEVDDVETTTEDDEVVETTTEEVDDVETTEVDGEEADLESFDVTSLNAPESAEVGDTITVSAVIENPNEVEATQDVAFRLEGSVVAREQVTLNDSASTTVEFEVDTSDVPPGEYVHGVYTRDFGELAVITLDEPTEGDAEETVETETDVGDEETELPDDEEETTVAVETTTEA